jgi:hypothetical protein
MGHVARAPARARQAPRLRRLWSRWRLATRATSTRARPGIVRKGRKFAAPRLRMLRIFAETFGRYNYQIRSQPVGAATSSARRWGSKGRQGWRWPPPPRSSTATGAMRPAVLFAAAVVAPMAGGNQPARRLQTVDPYDFSCPADGSNPGCAECATHQPEDSFYCNSLQGMEQGSCTCGSCDQVRATCRSEPSLASWIV